MTTSDSVSDYHSAEEPGSPSSPLGRPFASFQSDRSIFSRLDSLPAEKGDVSVELVEQFLHEVEIRFPGTLRTLCTTGEIKREDELHLYARRVLRADKLNVYKAVDRAVAHATWREGVLPNGVMAYELSGGVKRHAEEKKVFLVLQSRASRPCLIVRVNRHTAGLEREQLRAFIVYCMELSVYLCDLNPDQNKIDVVFDARDMKWRNYDVAGLKAVFEILERRYFERIGTIFMFKGPKLLDMLWSIVSPFVDEHTRTKIQFVNNTAQTERMMDVLGRDVMPDDFLGTPIQEQVKDIARAGEISRGRTCDDRRD